MCTRRHVAAYRIAPTVKRPGDEVAAQSHMPHCYKLDHPPTRSEIAGRYQLP